MMQSNMKQSQIGRSQDNSHAQSHSNSYAKSHSNSYSNVNVILDQDSRQISEIAKK